MTAKCRATLEVCANAGPSGVILLPVPTLEADVHIYWEGNPKTGIRGAGRLSSAAQILLRDSFTAALNGNGPQQQGAGPLSQGMAKCFVREHLGDPLLIHKSTT